MRIPFNQDMLPFTLGIHCAITFAQSRIEASTMMAKEANEQESMLAARKGFCLSQA